MEKTIARYAFDDRFLNECYLPTDPKGNRAEIVFFVIIREPLFPTQNSFYNIYSTMKGRADEE